MSRPYIHVTSYKELPEGQVEIQWQVNGCHTLNAAAVRIDNQIFKLTKDDELYTCNYLLGRAET
jgi:hypothetical protein